jgi:hypothetical protein
MVLSSYNTTYHKKTTKKIFFIIIICTIYVFISYFNGYTLVYKQTIRSNDVIVVVFAP